MAEPINIQDFLSSPIQAIFISKNIVSLEFSKNTPKFIRECVLKRLFSLKYDNDFTDLIFNPDNFCIEFKKSKNLITVKDLKLIKNLLVDNFKSNDLVLNEDFLYENLSSFNGSQDYIDKPAISTMLKLQLVEEIKKFSPYVLDYTSHTKFKSKLKLHNLAQSDNEEWLFKAAKWCEDKWGYLRNYPGIEKRIELVNNMKDKLYIITYDNLPIGMFAFREFVKENDILYSRLKETKSLTYFYIEQNCRNIGIGGQVIEMIKDKAHELGIRNLTFGTLNPKLNAFYGKHSAKLVCDNQFKGFPEDQFRMSTGRKR
ncbi:MAG: hypothetical protein ACK4OM_05765 [Alphaproteobacteria bacterium]